MNLPARILIILLVSVLSTNARTDELTLKSGVPDRYVVQPGDTLWGVSNYFLETPWRWPEIWQANPNIDNPHLIFPGDVLLLTDIGGKPGLRVLRREDLRREKVEPRIREGVVNDAITTIPPEIIRPFLTTPLIVGKEELLKSGYVMVGVEDNIILGGMMQFYARGLPEPRGDLYQVFRPGDHLIHPVTEEYLGTEAVYLGDARMMRGGDVSKLEITRAVDEIHQKDRLMEIEKDISEPYYHPHAPDGDILGYIIKAPKGVSEVGLLSVVVISLGEANGMEEGHVLRIKHSKSRFRDPVTREWVQLPEEDSGLLMVFRAFERVSYALILNSHRSIHLGDTVVNPLN